MKRWLIGMLSVGGLLMVYLFQKTDFGAVLGLYTPLHKFIFNRTVRFFLNDLFMIGLIYALFKEKKYVLFALWVQLAGVIFLLLPYFVLKINFPKYNGPLISYLHRLVLNPTLLLLLIPAFYYQQKFPSKGRDAKRY
jgi:exosortase F-associated protein